MSFPPNSELLYSWGRYLYWADLMQRDWDRFMAEKGENANKAIPEWLGVSCYWAASEYVVIEGWETADFDDPVVDALLGLTKYKEMLRRLRNGTFHYQPALISPKVVEFFQSPDVTLWLYFLHEEFCRWLRDCVEIVERSALLSPGQSQEWRDDFAKLVGWLPLRPAERELKRCKQTRDETEAKLDASGSCSEAALDLRASLSLYEDAVKKTAEAVQTRLPNTTGIESRRLHRQCGFLLVHVQRNLTGDGKGVLDD
jgi:hypothetical protein